MRISKILLFTLITLVSTKNVVLIGDSRAVGIGVYLFGFLYSHVTPSYGTGSNIIGTSARNYGGYSCKIVAETGASFATFVNTAESVNRGVTTVLKDSASGTAVLLWLGVNNLNADSTGSYYKSLANKYKKLKFYVIPVTGVTSKSGISNASIKSFNSKLNSIVKASGLSNLKYKNILQNNDPTKIVVGGKVALTVDASTTDAYGLHYKTNGYKAIFNAMVSGL
jgi:hypothetical protein